MTAHMYTVKLITYGDGLSYRWLETYGGVLSYRGLHETGAMQKRYNISCVKTNIAVLKVFPSFCLLYYCI